MKLISFATRERPAVHVGILQQNNVIDIALAGQALHLSLPEQMLDLIEHYERYEPQLRRLLDAAGGKPLSEEKALDEIGAIHAIEDVQITAPIPRLRKNVVCLAVNYREHARETATVRGLAGDVPDVPIFFTKATTALNGPYGQIVIDPAISRSIDWEIELGVILGKSGKNIAEEDALSYVFGYTIINDVTARDLQSRHKQFFKGKSLDSSCPMGPCIVTADEIPDPHKLALRLRVNGEIKQDANTGLMIFSIPQIISVLSAGMTLEAGDVIATGTPSGVGFSRTPPEFLQPGDIVEGEIEGIGRISNSVVLA